MSKKHLKKSLVQKKFAAVFESVQKMNSEKRKEFAESFGHKGLFHSGPHSKAVMNLELDGLKRMLESKLEIDLEVYFKKTIPHTNEDEKFLKKQIKELYEARLKTTKQELHEYFTSRRIPSLVSEYEREANIILSGLIRKIEILKLENQISIPKLPDKNIDQLIEGGESDQVEFKSTFQWDVKHQKRNDVLRMEAVKTVAAFNNFEGGYLLIGVSDNQSIFGLEKDYSSLSKKSRDGFTLALTQEIENRISREFVTKVKIDFYKKDEKDICRILVNPGDDGVWVKINKREKQFFIRTQNSSRALPPDEAAEYIRRKWPTRK